MSKPIPIRIENYEYLQQIWRQQQMISFNDVLRWCKIKGAVPILQAMQKKIIFHHDKDMDILKLSCNSPNQDNTCLCKSTDTKLYPFTGQITN